MSEVASTERCACPDPHPTADGRCVEPSIRSEDPGDPTLATYTWCGCCMADCPDVHPDSERELTAVPGSVVVAQEFFDTLPAEKQEALRAQEARGELRIAPQSEMGVRDPSKVRILRSALRHSGEADALDD
ncbi:hypothetical protein ACP6C7_03775 [Mycolicibacterium septicum]|uniref:4Fe-4S ferredoxin-type domain-containing protein n=1 Tax=Mycolicibacterium septicum TaxID=98668 RepID=A0ABW9LRG2_9MYCO